MDLIVLLIIVAVLAFVFFIGYTNEKRTRKDLLAKIESGFGSIRERKYSADELKAIKGFHRSCKTEYEIDDITWNDLDMWSVYKRVNFCYSSSGDEYLYHLLKSPYSSDYDFSSFEEKITGLGKDMKSRARLCLMLHDMGRSGKYSVSDYLSSVENAENDSIVPDIVKLLMYIPVIVLCFINALWGVGALIVLMIVEVSTYFKKKRSVEQYITCIEYIYGILVNSEQILSIDIEALKEEKEKIGSYIHKFNKFRRFSSLLVGKYGSGPFGVLLDYIKMLTHVDLIKCNTMLNEVKLHKNDIIDLITLIGYIDVCLSVGEFRASLATWSEPSLSNSHSEIKLVNGYHPLLSNPVANSITTSRGIVLTGSNASGKSTFLKMVAVNVLLSQSLHTACAESYEAPFYKLVSSMNLKDSIISGDSYYMAEIKAIKRIIDEDGAVLGFVDEVLRGTNTNERIASAASILHELCKENKTVFAATHDMELAYLMQDEYDNYHFEEKLENGDVVFPYTLMKGKSNGRNAISLLGYLGIDNHITDNAEKMVQNYEEKGSWCLL